MNKYKVLLLQIISMSMISGCANTPDALVVMTHDSFAISESTIAAFEAEQGVEVIFLPSGDAGSTLNRAILSKDSPQADVLYGIDNTFLSRALEEDLFVPFTPLALAGVVPSIPLTPENEMVPIDYGDVCINYDKAYFLENDLSLPASFEDLLVPAYAGLLVVENPATSSPGLAFLLATIAEFGEDGYLGYWQKLIDNGVVIVNDWETAYYTNFSGSAGRGAQPMVVSYGTSPAAEVIFAETKLDESLTASLVGDNMCFRQVEYAGILKGSKNQKMAQAFIEYMLSPEFQADIPLNMFVYPVIENASIPQEFLEFTQVPEKPAELASDQIALQREIWIQDWRELITQ